MTGRRWTSMAIAGTLTLAVVGSGVAWLLRPSGKGEQSSQAVSAPAKSPMRTLAEGIKRGDPAALTTLCQRVLAKGDQPQPAVSEEEGAEIVEVLQGLRGGFLKYSPVGRASAVSVATHLFDRFRVEPAPTAWFESL